MNTAKTRASRTLFEQLTLALNTAARQHGGIHDHRTAKQLFARDPKDDDDYAEDDISAIWFGWRLHMSYAEFATSRAVPETAHVQPN
jgi:hypothetical protein